MLDRYDANKNGEIDESEREAMREESKAILQEVRALRAELEALRPRG